MAVGRPVARIVDAHVEQSALARAAEQRDRERAVEVLGEDAVDVDAHDGRLVRGRGDRPAGRPSPRRAAARRRTPSGPAPRRRGRAGRAPGWPRWRRPIRARCRRGRRTTLPISSCAHRSSASASASGSAVRTTPRSSSAASRVSTPAKWTMNRPWWGRDSSTSSDRSPAYSTVPGIGAFGPVGRERQHHVAAHAVGAPDSSDLESCSGGVGHGRAARATTPRRRRWRARLPTHRPRA